MEKKGCKSTFLDMFKIALLLRIERKRKLTYINALI